jgi:N-methylhydantoinase A
MAKRVGVDVGGTFTDLILEDETTGNVVATKVPSTPREPSRGVLRAVTESLPVGERHQVRWLIHGHTVGLNALLERRGAAVGLLATEGFRDVIEIRRGDRGDPYDLFWQPPEPLVPRRLRIGIGGRIKADGSVVRRLDEEAVLAAAELFVAEKIESVAIAFMNAYANPSHELRAAELLVESGFSGGLSLSHAVSGEYREFERTSTTLVDAYIRPSVSGYLSQLRRDLSDNGIEADVLVSRSGGGALDIEDAGRRPCESIMSGPVGGVQGAARIAFELGLGDVVTADVGGTSFDTCMVVDGKPVTLHQGEIVGFPIQTPWVDVRSIGAGGGSVAYVDAGGLLRVGPESAGAEPGPACYRRGGEEPTVTDAGLLLGMLGKGRLAGDLNLDRDAAEAAFTPLCQQLGRSSEEVAGGVMTIAAANMAGAIREITIEQGRDPRRLALVAFGGAGPLFACLLAEELRIETIVVPPHAGNFSAHGLLEADIVRSAARTHVMALGGDGAAAAAQDAAVLLAELGGRENGGGGEQGVQLDLRYSGQEHTLTLDVEIAETEGRIAFAADYATIAAEFSGQYERRFGVTLGDPVEIVSIRAQLRQVVANTERGSRLTPSRDSAKSQGLASTTAFSMREQRWLDFALGARASLRPGEPLSGPAILTEETTTAYVDSGWEVEVGQHGALLLNNQGDR